MQDQDLIARVYAVAQHAGLADEAIESSIHYVRPQEQQHPPRATAYNSREPTPAPEECNDTLLPDVDGSQGRRTVSYLDVTQRPSGAHTPGVGLVCLNKEIGRGVFAVVTHHWNVSTGNEYVVKQPLHVRNIDRQAWENEAQTRRTRRQQATCQRRVAQVSHISTRELLFDKPGLVRIIVRRQAVSMRTSSFQINASDLFRLVQLDKRSRDNLIRKLKQHQAIEWETTKKNGWVPFRDGVFLCQALGIENELRPLLLQSRINLPRRERNYLLRDPDGFKVLQWNGYDLPYNPRKQIVSITALVRLTNAAWEQVYQFLRTRPKITKTVIRKGTAIFIGTYISYEDAMSVGRRFNLDLATVEHLASSAPSPHMTSAALSPVASTSVSNVASLDDTQLCDLTHNDVGSAVAGTSDPAQDADTSTEQCSFFTEANYKNGSYLAPAHQSHLELLGAVHPVEGFGKMSTASSGYGIGSCDSGFEFAEFLTEA
ncbi:hypothetical protein MY4824_007200 [Beauveria thailandica]